MDFLQLLTLMAIDACSPRQPTIFYRLLTRRTIYDTPSTVAEMREAPSTLRANSSMRTRFAVGRSTTGIMVSRLRARPPELSRQRPQLAEPPRDGRGTTTTTVINDKEKESFVNEPKDDEPTDSGSGQRRKEGKKKKTRRIKEIVYYT
jgi:hypothetical protein